ncbi:GTP-binding protein [Glutamicibacter halophytocola]|uniref:GTP-binding protein n=1 Tax=Glutamicibacter halophytocola TaxID=1933880 RepID=UPI00321AEC3C
MIPVIVLTGYLGAGKTSLLNGLLTRPGTRVGVIINDIGKINVDTGLITGQIDAAESIAGGCVCCLPDSGGLDELLEKLAQPKLRLDAIIVEASGAADPINVDRLLRYGNAPGVRPGGIIDVIDAVQRRTYGGHRGHGACPLHRGQPRGGQQAGYAPGKGEGRGLRTDQRQGPRGEPAGGHRSRFARRHRSSAGL